MNQDFRNYEDETENKDESEIAKETTEELLAELFPEKKEEQEENLKKKKKKSSKKSSFLTDLFDWVEIISLSFAFVLLIFTFVARLAVVDGPSMEETLHDGDRLIVSGLFYTPKNNDIIVFEAPQYTNERIVKRIIAVAGQTVDIDFEKWKVYVDGNELSEDYVKHAFGDYMRDYQDGMEFPLTVPEGYVFVMGDNRNNSIDSRSARIGLIDTRFILGKVEFRIYPFEKIGEVH